jgi:DNA-binding transcriptional LysR family regulator
VHQCCIFHRRYPGVAVRLTVGTSAPLLAQVAGGELDAAIIAHPESPLPNGISDEVFLRDLIEAAFRRAGLTLTVAYASNDPSLHVALAKQGVGTALAAGSDPSVRNAVGVTCLPLDPPIPYDKLLIWRAAEPPPAPVRALLNIWHQLSGSSSSDSEQSANE